MTPPMMPDTRTLFEPSLSRRRPPVNLDPADAPLFAHEMEHALPAMRVRELRNVRALPSGVLTWRGRVLPESFVFPSPPGETPGFLTTLKLLAKAYAPGRARTLDGPVLWFTDTWSNGFFHWMLDALPRLFAIRDLARGATLTLPEAFRAQEGYIRPSLRPFDIGGVEFFNTPLLCRRFTLATHAAATGNYNEQLIRELRGLYAKYYAGTGTPFGDRIYISRGKSQRRKIRNEEEILPVLRARGFQILYFEELNFDEQAAAALNARYLVSNHGAGLTNMLFMPAGSRVLELRKREDARNNCYFALASALELPYHYLLCDAVHPGEDPHTADLLVNPAALDAALKSMLPDGNC